MAQVQQQFASLGAQHLSACNCMQPSRLQQRVLVHVRLHAILDGSTDSAAAVLLHTNSRQVRRLLTQLGAAAQLLQVLCGCFPMGGPHTPRGWQPHKLIHTHHKPGHHGAGEGGGGGLQAKPSAQHFLTR